MRKYQRHNQAEMFSHIENCKQTGQTQKAYCKQNGLAYSTFHYWVIKYRKEVSGKQLTDRPAGFIPVKVQSEPEVSGSDDNQLHFLYPNGIQVMCSERISSEVLKTLINP